jgi:hypothetical protein
LAPLSSIRLRGSIRYQQVLYTSTPFIVLKNLDTSTTIVNLPSVQRATYQDWPFNFSGTLDPGNYELSLDVEAWDVTIQQRTTFLVPTPGTGVALLSSLFFLNRRRR